MNSPLDVPRESGMLPVGQGHVVYYEVDGNPNGIPALYLHGGPGAPLRRGHLSKFDLGTYRVISLQQRGAGLSTPHAEDGDFRPDDVATKLLVDDVEALRTHLGIDSWLLVGTSWGSTLALQAAVRNPSAVRGIVLVAVTSTSPAEVDWISQGVAVLYPESWDQLATTVEAHSRWRRGQGRIIDAVADVMTGTDQAARREVAAAWMRWEETHIQIGLPVEQLRRPSFTAWPERDLLAFVTLVSIIWSRHAALDPAWVGPAPLRDQLHLLADIPVVMVHGRRDVSGPVTIPWELKGLMPHAELHVVEHEGHGGATMGRLWATATDCFAARGDFTRIVDFL